MTEPRCYTLAQVLEKLHLSRSALYEAKRRGRLPFLQEIVPRVGVKRRFRADLIDLYLAGQWNTSRALRRV